MNRVIRNSLIHFGVSVHLSARNVVDSFKYVCVYFNI